MGGVAPGILITRTLPGATETAARIIELGYRAFLSPVLEIHKTSENIPDIDGVQAIIATSAHGVKAITDIPNAQNLPLYCFDGSSLKVAKARCLGGPIHSLRGNAEDLCALVQKKSPPKNGPFLWVHGRHFAFDVREKLSAEGFNVQVWEAYEAKPSNALGAKSIQAIRTAQIKAVVFHSARGVKTFMMLAHKHSLSLAQIDAITISAEAAKPLKSAGFSNIHIAQDPSDEAMLALLQTCIAII